MTKDEENRARGKAQNDINRADETRTILESRVYIDAMTMIKGDLYNDFINSEDSKQRDEIHRQVNAVTKLEKILKRNMLEGKMGQQTLSLIARAKKVVGL